MQLLCLVVSRQCQQHAMAKEKQANSQLRSGVSHMRSTTSRVNMPENVRHECTFMRKVQHAPVECPVVAQ